MELRMEKMGLEVGRKKRRRRSCSDGKKKRKEEEAVTNDEAEVAVLFPLILAAITKQREGGGGGVGEEPVVSLIKKCLKRLRLWIASGDDRRLLPITILSLIPPILSSRLSV